MRDITIKNNNVLIAAAAATAVVAVTTVAVNGFGGNKQKNIEDVVENESVDENRNDVEEDNNNKVVTVNEARDAASTEEAFDTEDLTTTSEGDNGEKSPGNVKTEDPIGTPKTMQEWHDVLEEQEKTLGVDHKDTTKTRSHLSNLYYDGQDYKACLPLDLANYQSYERTLGRHAVKTMVVMNNIAKLYEKIGSEGGDEDHNSTYYFEKAEDLYKECYKKRQLIQGDYHDGTLSTLNNLLMLYAKYDYKNETEEDIDAVENLYKDCLKKQTQHFRNEFLPYKKHHQDCADVFQTLVNNYQWAMEYYFEDHDFRLTILNLELCLDVMKTKSNGSPTFSSSQLLKVQKHIDFVKIYHKDELASFEQKVD